MNRVFNVINIGGLVLSVPLLLVACAAFLDPVTLGQAVMLATALAVFPVLAIAGSIMRRRWLGAVGLVLAFSLRSCEDPDAYRMTNLDRIAFEAARTGNVDVLRLALADGVAPDMYFREEGTLLGNALLPENTETVALIIDAGANIHARGGVAGRHSLLRNGGSPIIKALHLWRCDAARVLLEAGANPNDRLLNNRDYELSRGYENASARQLYEMNKRKWPTIWRQQEACWRQVEMLMGRYEEGPWARLRRFRWEL